MSRKRGTHPDHRKVIRADVTRVDVLGTGNKITFTVKALRQLETGRYEYLDLHLDACRYSVKALLTELKGMHTRDRERIAQELARIDAETKVLQP